LIGTRPAELIHPDDLSIIDEFRAKLLTRAGTAAITYRMRRKDGSYVWVETTWQAIRSNDAVTEMVAVARDVSERVTG
jgi:PAS domain S-box-containing protein